MERKKIQTRHYAIFLTQETRTLGHCHIKDSKIACPLMPPYQAPKGRLKFPMSPSPQQEHISTRYKIGLQGKPCLILALASWVRQLQLSRSSSVSSVYSLKEDSLVLLSTFRLPIMCQKQKSRKLSYNKMELLVCTSICHGNGFSAKY